MLVSRSRQSVHARQTDLTTGCKVDVEDSVACLKYYAGFADKIHGNVIEISDQEKSAITRKEPVG